MWKSFAAWTSLKSVVSWLCGSLHEWISKWNERPLKGTTYPFLQADALAIRVRENRKVIKKVIQLATGVSQAGVQVEVLGGIQVARQESEVGWKAFFTGSTTGGVWEVWDTSPPMTTKD